MSKLSDFTARSSFTRASNIALAQCEGTCCCHLLLSDEDDLVFADAPMDRALAAKYGAALVRIGAGEDVAEVCDDIDRSKQGSHRHNH